MPQTDLASERVGGVALAASDEFFAPKENILKEAAAEWREGAYTDHGKWMDGWETRRRRTPGYDWCVVRLGIPGEVHQLVVDTSHFKGNFPEACSLEGCGVGSDHLLPEARWEELLPRSPLRGGTENCFALPGGRRTTHVRLNIYPDGGVARLRVIGEALPALGVVAPAGGQPDLAGLAMGGRVVDASDTFFSPPDRMLLPGPSAGMFDGWETARRRGPGHDWAVVRLGLPGTPHRVMADTSHFKGNAPGWVSVDASPDESTWEEVLGSRPVAPHHHHLFELEHRVPASYVRLNIYPDGGVARFRVFGEPDPTARTALRFRYLNALFDQEAHRFFHAACGSERFAGELVRGRPYSDPSVLWKAVEAAFATMSEQDWMEAFDRHPRIGGGDGGQGPTGEAMSAREQAGTTAASGPVQAALVEANARYEERFGFRFVVFAAGKTATEMLEIARRRLGNDRATEQEMAAAEQRRITDLRLRRMLCVEAVGDEEAG